MRLAVISIRAPARGATRHVKNVVEQLEFQSALPRGERHFTCRLKGSCINISIRAPTRGATQIDRSIDVNLIFQSALPRGERHRLTDLLTLTLYFNPRSHEGSDCRSRHGIQKYTISIRAPTRGATPVLQPLSRSIVFQSALPRGERHGL